MSHLSKRFKFSITSLWRATLLGICATLLLTALPASAAIDSSSFAAKVDFLPGNTPYAVGIGDFDGDGKLDLAVPNANSNTVSVFRNTSTNGSITSGSFATKVDFATGSAPNNVEIGDLDGDGKVDLVVTNYANNTVSVFRNTNSGIGSITFATKVDFATYINPIGIAIGDLDGDGKLDFAVSNDTFGYVSVYRNTSTSGSITSTSFAAKVDFVTGARPLQIAIGDIDGDGKRDLVVANAGGSSVSVYRNTSTIGSITSTSFAAKVDFTTGVSPAVVTINDLDKDGKPDIAVANYASNSASVLRNTSTSGSITSTSFAAKVDFATGVNPYGVAIGDFDGDGKLEIVTANYSGDSVSVLRNTSTSGSITSTSFAAKVDFTTGAKPLKVGIGDFDGDGKLDLAVANNVNSELKKDVNTLANW